LLHSTYGEYSGGWLKCPEYLLVCYVDQLPRIQAQQILQMVEAFSLAAPANDDDELRSKQRRMRELQRQATVGKKQEKEQMTMQQFAGLMSAMGMGFEVIEGEVLN
jgi:hypothetical protein